MALVKDKALSGIVPPMVTPLLEAGGLDVGGLERLVEHVLGGNPMKGCLPGHYNVRW